VNAPTKVSAAALEAFAAAVLERLGIPAAGARVTAAALVAADLEGVPSHGVMLLPMYAERLLAGSVSKSGAATVAHDGGAAIVLDAGDALGQITSRQAVDLLLERTPRHGLASVAVRNGFHFGAAGYWTRMLAARGLVGVAMCNTRPLMPPPGGAERMVGNNPLAIAMPSTDSEPLVLDMAMSASAMGKIRLAASAGRAIPEGWAVDAHGAPTTDPATAIKGMLLPAAGPKGFGLAMMIDILSGGFSGGAIGAEVKPLYGDAAVPYRCAHFFMAIDPAPFGVDADFARRVAGFAGAVRDSKPAPGVDRVHAPGDIERLRRESAAGTCAIPPDVREQLVACGAKAGVDAPPLG
jgi:LDH2 family malate/lactate/ureidoglycolate dehydrogenase